MKSILLVTILVLLQGCSTYAVNRYSMSMDNVEQIKRAVDGRSISVGTFTAVEPGRTTIMCRGVGPIKTPDGEPFEAYIRKALIDELRLAGAYDSAAQTNVTGTLKSIDFTSVGGAWTIVLEVQSNQGRRFEITETYQYTTSYFGETACNQTAQAVMPAIQNLVKSVVSHPEFQLIATEQ
ncbi:hypothetical protein [Pseudomonas sp. 2FE]|uniref:hypothetical protein n=1 Tax=Pseudomonas sp. 2FE TaxID=2502190 RepID=UPI0010F99599|nr:hypothetical protein [Pseudomonas sp. 2FE]